MHLSNHITNTDSFSHAAVKATNANNKLHQIYCLGVVVRGEAVVVRGEADVVVSNRTNKELVAFGGLSYCHINYMICAIVGTHKVPKPVKIISSRTKYLSTKPND